MSDMPQLPPWMFNLEGTFLGFLGQSSIKSLVLEVDQEQMAIQLPKKLRACVQQHQLQPGTRLRCIGRSQLDFDENVIKLKAQYVMPLSSSAQDNGLSSPSAPAGGTAAVASQRSTEISKYQSLLSQTGPAKVLVCRKSDCQKRGGRRLVAALEQILREQQLHKHVKIQYVGCQKRCSKAPTLTIMPGKYRYDRMDLNNLPALVEKHFHHPELCSDLDE